MVSLIVYAFPSLSKLDMVKTDVYVSALPYVKLMSGAFQYTIIPLTLTSPLVAVAVTGVELVYWLTKKTYSRLGTLIFAPLNIFPTNVVEYDVLIVSNLCPEATTASLVTDVPVALVRKNDAPSAV